MRDGKPRMARTSGSPLGSNPERGVSRTSDCTKSAILSVGSDRLTGAVGMGWKGALRQYGPLHGFESGSRAEWECCLFVP
jgi:hypothetical protein